MSDQKQMKDALDKFIAATEGKKDSRSDDKKEDDPKSKKEYDYSKIDQATQEIKVLSQQIQNMMSRTKSDKSETKNQPLAGLVGNYFSRTRTEAPIQEIDANNEEDSHANNDEDIKSEAGFQAKDKARAYK